jgi:hypothetical protein
MILFQKMMKNYAANTEKIRNWFGSLMVGLMFFFLQECVYFKELHDTLNDAANK